MLSAGNRIFSLCSQVSSMGIEISWHSLFLYKRLTRLCGDRLESNDETWFSILLTEFVVGSIVNIGTFVDTGSYAVTCELSNDRTATLR